MHCGELKQSMVHSVRLLILLLAFASATGLAVTGGTLAGTVADPSGAMIPGVVVTARHTETHVAKTTVTNESGFYAFPTLASGQYELQVDHPGFRPYKRSGLEISSNAALRVDIVLTLGERIDTILVTQSSDQVETANTQMGELISAKRMTDIPVNGRSYTDLLSLQPAVTPISSRQPDAVVMAGAAETLPSGDLNPGNMSVNGQRETSNGFSVNGSSAQEDFNMYAAIVPNLDSIHEFRVLTSNFDAEHGNFSGGQVLVTTKSGTNQLHGSAFEFIRDASLASRNYFAAERPAYRRNQFGGTLGGPIRKDKTFFFADYQGTRMTQGVETGLISVPSIRNRSGDFTDIADSLTGAVNGQYWAERLSKKLGYPVFPGEPYYTPGCANAPQCVLPNAQIPERAWSAPAKFLLPYIPEPNRGAGTFSTSAYNQVIRDDKGALRVDHNTPWGALSGYYFADDYFLDNPYPTGQGGANVPGFSAISEGRAQLATIGLTTSFGASTVNEFRLGYMRSSNDIGRPVGGVGPKLVSQGFVDEAGKPGIVALAPEIEGVENIGFNDFTMGVDLTGVRQANNTYQISDDFSRVVGRHIVKFGAGMHYDHVNIRPNARYNGAFLFYGSETGSDFADFLLGIASNYHQGDSEAFYLRNKYIGVYGQDSWQLRPNLTLNYGLRWDLLPPWREKYNQIQTLVLGQQSIVYPGAPAGLVFPGDPGIPDTLAPAKNTNFGPRIGLAYSPSAKEGILRKLLGEPGKTSVRVGYGLFYTAFEGLSGGIMSANPPYGLDYESLAPPLFETPFITAAGGQDGGQKYPSPIPALGASAKSPNASVDWSKFTPVTGVPSFYYRNRNPYSESYTLSIQREIARDTVLTASYVGSQAHHLLVLVSANPGNPELCASLSKPENVMPGTPTCGPFGESGVYITRAGQQINGTRGPFNSDFAAINYQKTIGNSNYNSLAVSLRHSSPSIEFLLGYTYGKSIDQSSSLAEVVNPLNASLTRAVSAFDMRHSFVGSYTWQLPVTYILRRKNGWTNGWALSGTTRLSTGLPVTLFNNNDTSLLGTVPNGINNYGVDTPDYTPGDLEINTDPRNGKPAFNTSLFSLPELGRVGTASRRFFYGPGIFNFDMTLRKQVHLSERRMLELRFEAFNVFNHAQFYGPAAVNANISSANFGRIVSAAAPRLVQTAARFSF